MDKRTEARLDKIEKHILRDVSTIIPESEATGLIEQMKFLLLQRRQIAHIGAQCDESILS